MMLATYQYRCDRCGTHAESGQSMAWAGANARRDGWNLDKARDLCGACWQAVLHGAEMGTR